MFPLTDYKYLSDYSSKYPLDGFTNGSIILNDLYDNAILLSGTGNLESGIDYLFFDSGYKDIVLVR